MKDVVAVGLGNPLMRDEGVGVRLIEELARGADRFPGVEFLDLGTGGMRVLHAIAGRRKAVFIDCAMMNQEPGAIRSFAPEAVLSKKDPSITSLHQGDLLEVIELSRRLDECPEEIIIFGIQPEDVSPGESLSPALQERFETYVRTIAAELE